MNQPNLVVVSPNGVTLPSVVRQELKDLKGEAGEAGSFEERVDVASEIIDVLLRTLTGGMPVTVQVIPEWIRIPRNGERCPHFGLTKPYYHWLLRSAKVKSKMVRQPGKESGIRLINYASVRAFLEKIPEDTKETA